MSDEMKVTGVQQVKVPDGEPVVSSEEIKKAPVPNSVYGDGIKQDEPKKNDYNVFGKDVANFAHFGKGNDANDAMQMTNTIAGGVKREYLQLQHDFPSITIEFEPMPDPAKCGKKREGFNNYKVQLAEWKATCEQQLSLTRNEAAANLVRGAAGAVMTNNNMNTGAIIANDNRNAAVLDRQIEDKAEEVEQTVTSEGKKTRSAVYSEGSRTRGQVKDDGTYTRAVV
ncbi:MAG: hypothetical protein LBJ74_03420, partial [Heliobacteriaceae bacterium]|nr:hypothetical protein [Heliobacteriaceae bacterium]